MVSQFIQSDIKSIKIGRYSFKGFYFDTASIENKSGLYAIYCFKRKKAILMDIGEATKLKKRIDTHDRKGCWERNCKGGKIAFAVHYTPNLHKRGRMKIETELRNNNLLFCGEQ